MRTLLVIPPESVPTGWSVPTDWSAPTLQSVPTLRCEEDAKGIGPLPDHINDATIFFKNGRVQRGKEATSESNTEKVPERPVSARTVAPEGSDRELRSDLDQSRPSSWFVNTQRDIMYHSLRH